MILIYSDKYEMAYYNQSSAIYVFYVQFPCSLEVV